MRQLQAELTAREFAEYCALEAIMPWPDRAADYRHAELGAWLAAALGTKRPRLADFLPFWLRRTRPRQAVSEMAARFAAFADAHNSAQRQGARRGDAR